MSPPAFEIRKAGQWTNYELQEKINQDSGLNMSVFQFSDSYGEYNYYVGSSIKGDDYKMLAGHNLEKVNEYLIKVFPTEDPPKVIEVVREC